MSETPGGWRPAMVGWAAAWLLRLVRSTVRIRFHDQEEIRRFEAEDVRFVLAGWHRNLLLMRWAYRGGKVTVMSSRSKDGEIITQALLWMGVRPSRGSSSRGGVAGLREMLRLAAKGYNMAFTPDGPRGPACVVQPGVVLAAALSGAPIVPMAYAATRARRLGTWDRLLLPLPFSTVHVVYGPALRVARDADIDAEAVRLGTALQELELRAAELAGDRRDPSDRRRREREGASV